MKKRNYLFCNYNAKAFTFVELLLGLTITAIILTAVATLAFALGSAYDSDSDVNEHQAYIRHATLRLTEKIRNCSLICARPGRDLVLWRADDNGNGQPDVDELTYIETNSDTVAVGNGEDFIRFMEFSYCGSYVRSIFSNSSTKINFLCSSSTKAMFKFYCTEFYTTLIPVCSNVQFVLDTAPPYTQLVTISFDLNENGITRHYQISAKLRGWAGNILNETGEIFSGDDD